MTAYLDTHVLVWILENDLRRIRPEVLKMIDRFYLLVSPMVLLELEYLYEIERTQFTAAHLRSRMEHDLQIQVCSLSFERIAEAALQEKWTRDPFDRVIVAQAKANRFATLITADAKIRENYPEAFW